MDDAETPAENVVQNLVSAGVFGGLLTAGKWFGWARGESPPEPPAESAK